MKCLRYVSILSFYFSGVLFMCKKRGSEQFGLLRASIKNSVLKILGQCAGYFGTSLFAICYLLLLKKKNVYQGEDFVTCRHDETGVLSVSR